jgi:NADH:ubiquinone oxidoreductase subunit D
LVGFVADSLSCFSIYSLIFNIFNSGPQHPATHGVLRSIAILHGEIIQWISPEIGLLHRGTEKLIECNYYNSNIGYFDRSDHVSGVIQELVFILILERIINCYCSNYISLWRTLLIEFYRNPNHSLNITTHAIDIGLFTTMP